MNEEIFSKITEISNRFKSKIKSVNIAGHRVGKQKIELVRESEKIVLDKADSLTLHDVFCNVNSYNRDRDEAILTVLRKIDSIDDEYSKANLIIKLAKSLGFKAVEIKNELADMPEFKKNIYQSVSDGCYGNESRNYFLI